MKDFEGGRLGGRRSRRISARLRWSGSSLPTFRLPDGRTLRKVVRPNFLGKIFSFTCPTYTLTSGHSLEVKLIVNGSSDDGLWFAYDTNPYRTRLQIN